MMFVRIGNYCLIVIFIKRDKPKKETHINAYKLCTIGNKP